MYVFFGCVHVKKYVHASVHGGLCARGVHMHMVRSTWTTMAGHVCTCMWGGTHTGCHGSMDHTLSKGCRFKALQNCSYMATDLCFHPRLPCLVLETQRFILSLLKPTSPKGQVRTGPVPSKSSRGRILPVLKLLAASFPSPPPSSCSPVSCASLSLHSVPF